MSPARTQATTRRRPRGLTLIELMVALSISATILTAVGVSLNACISNYSANAVQADITQRARLSLNRMLMLIRGGTGHQPYTASAETKFAAGNLTNDLGISLITGDGVPVDFHYDAKNLRLLMTENGTDFEMVEGVSSFNIAMQPMKSATNQKTGGVYDELMRATLTIVIQRAVQSPDIDSNDAQQTLTLSSSAMPRQNIW